MLKIDFKVLRSESLRDIIYALEGAVQNIGIDYYLIGAVARDAWFQLEHIISRRTSDIDFAILMPEQKQFDELKTFLSKQKGYVETKGNSFTMISPEGTVIDILPFGSVEIDETVNATYGTVKIATNGFKEIYDAALASFDTDDEQLKVKVASLSGIVLLKLIAHKDRPELRIKDPGDILEIFRHYFDLHTAFIYEHHADLFEKETSLEIIATRVIGRNIGDIIKGNPYLRKKISDYLASEIAKHENSSLIRLMQRSSERYRQEEITTMIQELLKGIREGN
ncbi:hypothetical protein D9M68_551640 [compost metagenome]